MIPASFYDGCEQSGEYYYLPLAFCAVSSPIIIDASSDLEQALKALWTIPNITDSSTRTPFIVTAVLIGFVTYIIVFNLNKLVSFGWATYSGHRKRSIQRMTNESTGSKWKDLGRRFRRFEPDRGSSKLSDWYILLIAFSIRWEYSRSQKFLLSHYRKLLRKMQSSRRPKLGHDGYDYQAGNQNLAIGRLKQKKAVSSTSRPEARTILILLLE